MIQRHDVESTLIQCYYSVVRPLGYLADCTFTRELFFIEEFDQVVSLLKDERFWWTRTRKRGYVSLARWIRKQYTSYEECALIAIGMVKRIYGLHARGLTQIELTARDILVKRRRGKVRYNRPRGYKTFFMLNSIEPKILIAHKCEHIKKLSIFQAQTSLECYILFTNVKMPTIVGILTFMSRKKIMLNFT